MKMIRQTSFTMGEVDAVNWKRTDVEAYLSGAQSLLNCEIGTTGLTRKRKGTKLLSDVTQYIDINSQMYEFVDNNGVYYLLISKNTSFSIFTVEPFAFVQTITTPYLSADLLDVDYSLDNDVLILSHPIYPPARIYVSDYTTMPVTFAYQVLNIYPYPAYDFGNINYNNYTVTYSIGAGPPPTLTFVITNPAAAVTGFTNDWIGGSIVGAGNSANSPIGYAIITAVTPSGSPSGKIVTFTATIQIPFLASGFSTTGLQYSIKQSAWTSTSPVVPVGYPAKVAFYQNRLWFGSTKFLPTTVFGSQINSPLSFDVGIGRDTDAIVYTIGQSNSGPILWINGGKQLEIYTLNNEFVAPQNENVGLTPGTFSIRQQSSYGSSINIKPTTYINDSYYVAREGNAVVNFHFEGVGLAYSSANISVASTHLVKNPQNRALLRGSTTNQDNFIYYINTDNSITSFQFAAEYKLAAFTPIQFQTNITAKDLVTVNNKVYFLKKYELTSAYVIEVFDNTVKVDSYSDIFMDASGLIVGLSILNGYTVQVISNGQDYGQYEVVDGNINVNNVMGLPGTVTVGLLYPVDIKPMYVFSGSTQSNYFKNVSRIYVDYFNSLNFQVAGTQIDWQTFEDIQNSNEVAPKSGTAIVATVTGWNRFETFSITQNSPFDLQITAIAYQIDSTII